MDFDGAVPAWAVSANDAGAAAADTSVEGEIFLPLRDAAGAAALATAVSTPTSPTYKQFLTPQQWIAKYSPTQATSDAVVAYLKAAGASITAVPDSRQYVVFRANVAQVDAAFGTELHSYSIAGATLVAPSTAPSLPASLASQVSAVSIDQGRTLNHPDLVKPDSEPAGSSSQAQSKLVAPAATPAIVTPCSNYWAQFTVTAPAAYGQTQFPTANCGYTPRQIRSAYGLTPNVNTGAGQTVAIIDAYASPTIREDANTYSAQLGEPSLAGLFTQVVPDPSEFTDIDLCAGPANWQGEQTLDVEAVHGVAPRANIVYVGGTNCDAGIDVAMSKILDNKLATIVSNSYGNIGEAVSPDLVRGEENIFTQAAGEGIGLYFSSGDNGDEVAALGYASPDYSASSPLVTSVGGTSLAVAKDGSYLFETGWGSTGDQILNTNGKLSLAQPLPGTFRFGAGGGVSALFKQPAYQKGTVPTALAKGMRVSPDVAAVADPYTGFLIGLRPITDDTTLATGPFENSSIGGTSLASPVFAAQMALVQAGTKTTIGFANPLLYSVNKSNPQVFRDIVPQNPQKALVFTSPSTGITRLITLDTDTSLKTAKGYDDVTGIGSIDVNKAIASGAVK
ncbi:hypothetical protein B7R25_04015 [Subtercola boreus]|uniref:Peptidase S53 domain-containing protein n=1 Tax=Subtercola boreus TaxID=120213 RepID=A0A3E0WFF3_9MICO|nr:hypothetical protein B7R24_04005 [Subtercola boreus]RFA23209.1 hypothetical protein B7R23_04000 [Subtercola boreus]RFA28959.1 hypothetical protein B7R25_04015 [Subtercola boreus]